MGLANIIGKIATKEELIELLVQLEEENTRFRLAIEWALDLDQGGPVTRVFQTELGERADL